MSAAVPPKAVRRLLVNLYQPLTGCAGNMRQVLASIYQRLNDDDRQTLCELLSPQQRSEIMNTMKSLIVILMLTAVGFISTATAVTLQWDRHADDSVTGFVVNFEAVDGTDGPFVGRVEGRDATRFSVDDTRFRPGVEYRFTVSAYNANGISDPSNPVTGTPNPADYTPPAEALPTTIYMPPGVPVNIVVNP